MAEYKDIYKLGQSQEGSIIDLGQEIRLDLQLDDNVISESGTVFGIVLDGEGNPVQRVTVKLTDGDYNPKYHAITDEEGQYTIAEVETGSQYAILAVKDGYDLEQGIPFIMQQSQQIERNFVITEDPEIASSLVAGEVLTMQDEVIDHVDVALYDNSGDEPVLIKETHTNQFGQYAFFDVPQGMYLITSRSLGYTTTSTTFIIDGPSQVRNIILKMPVDPITRKGTINGVIKDKNNIPISNAYVILFEVTTDQQGKEILTPIKTTWTNSQGLYLFEQIPQGNYKIKANKTELD